MSDTEPTPNTAVPSPTNRSERREQPPHLHSRGIVTGQRVDATKVVRSRELRRKMTVAERRLWEQLRAGRLKGLKFRRQQIIDGFIVDFYCHAVGLVVEVDGAIHQAQAAYDAQRSEVLMARGLHVLRLSNTLIEQDLQSALHQIVDHCTSKEC